MKANRRRRVAVKPASGHARFPDMDHLLRRALLMLVTACSSLAGRVLAQTSDDTIRSAIRSHQFDVSGDGLRFLIDEAKSNQFFLLGELHGDQQIPELLGVLWPELHAVGYRHICAELSPWAAHALEFAPTGDGATVRGLWTTAEATRVHALAKPGETVLWGCDMEELQPDRIIRDLAKQNPGDSDLLQMSTMVAAGYRRNMASPLLDLASRDAGVRDDTIDDVSLQQNLVATLRIERDRSNHDDRLIAQNERELLMKHQFLVHFHEHGESSATGKVLFRFGRNHLHRGYDARGISTLGNFIAEFAAARGQTVFNVGAFGAGGKAGLLGQSWNADERQDEPTFALLAANARYAATVFDLRPLRPLLHSMPVEKWSAVERNLVYWADSYDALICYRTVSPRDP